MDHLLRGEWDNSDLLTSEFVAKETPSERERIYICDFRRCRLNARLYARIQPLLPGHKYRFFLFLRAVLRLSKQNQN